ncbi:RES domain-containing protein [uncultured Amnibacterium sp.]|uniref:RES domain-containing protein n=1 Tax=uncultured Amnibacterium sp. TaxID=1631851 RepID=UPI0035C9CAF8
MRRHLDEDLLQRVDHAGYEVVSASAWRHTTARRDPMSGAGARLMGGRWNPKDEFSTVYLATPLECCLAELERVALSQNLPTHAFLEVPRVLHEISVKNARLLDLRSEGALLAVGLSEVDVVGSDWNRCQAVGQAAWFVGLQGLVASSATSTGFVLALFEQRLEPGQTAILSTSPLTVESYEALNR